MESVNLDAPVNLVFKGWNTPISPHGVGARGFPLFKEVTSQRLKGVALFVIAISIVVTKQHT